MLRVGLARFPHHSNLGAVRDVLGDLISFRIKHREPGELGDELALWLVLVLTEFDSLLCQLGCFVRLQREDDGVLPSVLSVVAFRLFEVRKSNCSFCNHIQHSSIVSYIAFILHPLYYRKKIPLSTTFLNRKLFNIETIPPLIS